MDVPSGTYPVVFSATALRFVISSIITGNDFISNGADYQCQNSDGGLPANIWDGNFWSDWTGPAPTPFNAFICVKNAQDMAPSPAPLHYV